MELKIEIKLLLSALFTIYSVRWVFLKILKISKIKGIVDSPNFRKLQKNPIPVLGGLAVFFGLLMGLLFFSAISKDHYVVSSPLIIGAGILLFFGAMDDILNLTPKSRFFIEIAVILGLVYGTGMCIDSFHGLWGVYEIDWSIAVPLTILTGVGIINAYNMIDGVNGLSSGICIFCSYFYAIFFLNRSDYSDCALAFCFGSALLPFFLHNVFGSRSRMFIGDSGTMVMGLFMTWFTIQILTSQHSDYLNVDAINPKFRIGAIPLVLSIASVPVADAIRVMALRVFSGKSPFVGDKTHLHHMFIATGFSHIYTTFSEILINALIVSIWFITCVLGMSIEVQLYVTIGASALFVWGTYFFLSYHIAHRTVLLGKIKRKSAYTHLGHKQWWLRIQRYLDRQAFEDYRLIIVNRNNKALDELTKKDLYESSIVNYLQGRNFTRLSDLKKEGLIEDEYFDIVIRSLVEKKILECSINEKNCKIVRIASGSI